jgi:hypothetical protein
MNDQTQPEREPLNMEKEKTMDKLGTSHKALTRRDYFTGCALQALLRTKGSEKATENVVNEAIEIGRMVDTKLGDGNNGKED